MVEKRLDQPVAKHDAAPNAEAGVPSVYAAMKVPTLQDQADHGGWLPHAKPVHGDDPSLQTIGTRGSFIQAPDDDTK